MRNDTSLWQVRCLLLLEEVGGGLLQSVATEKGDVAAGSGVRMVFGLDILDG